MPDTYQSAQIRRDGCFGSSATFAVTVLKFDGVATKNVFNTRLTTLDYRFVRLDTWHLASSVFLV
jgi:hypothetical protein